MRKTYIHERSDWPRLHWDQGRLTNLLAHVRYRQGRLTGRMESLPRSLSDECRILTLAAEMRASSELAGIELDAAELRSELAHRFSNGGSDGRRGPADMMFDITRNYGQPLTADRLLDWHGGLFQVAGWRTGPRAATPIEVPPASRLNSEIAGFLAWFNRPPDVDLALKAGIAHLWFVTISPFADGNGRIARAIADLALARSENTPYRFYSLSTQLSLERAGYYEILEQTQTRTMDITPWLEWFLGCLNRAIDGAQTTLAPVLNQLRLRERLQGFALNERQTLVLNHLLAGAEGKLTTTKYAELAGCSHDTALRDLLPLVERNIVTRGAEGGRGTSYALVPLQFS